MKNSDKEEYVTASEIGQYTFCSVSWFIKKFQSVPVTLKEEGGKLKHAELGGVLEQIKTGEDEVKKSQYLIFIVAISLVILVGWLIWHLF